jgi:exopolysaccharide biosynthesis protein
MLKKLGTTVLMCFCIFITLAQDQDSLTLVKAKWSKKKVAPKLKLITFHFNHKELFKVNENISYLEVKPNRRKAILSLGYEKTLLKKTSTFAIEHQALAAINGSFFDVKNGGSVDYLRAEGKIISGNTLDKNKSRARHQQAALVITNGKLSLVKWDGSEDWEEKIKAEEVLLTGPMLTFNNQEQQLDTSEFSNLRHPRSSIGIKPNGKIILLTVDGRNMNSAGMSLPELAKTMRWLGCTSSINLDGGGSTTLWIKNFENNGIVNYPTDNKKWDHEGERKVANVILIKHRP